MNDHFTAALKPLRQNIDAAPGPDKALMMLWNISKAMHEMISALDQQLSDLQSDIAQLKTR